MTTTVGSIVAKLQADPSGLDRGLAAGARSVVTFERTTSARLARVDAQASRTLAVLARTGSVGFAALARSAATTLAPILSASLAIAGMRASLNDFGDTADRAAATGLDSEFFEGLKYQASLGGVAVDELAASLAAFAKNSGLAAEGRGKMVAALKALDPALLESIRNATTQEQRIKLVADALAKETDAARRAALAAAAFGQAGSKLATIFAGGASQIDVMQVKARELGLITDRYVIASADALGDRYDTAAQILDLKMKQALINLAPLLVNLTGLAADFAGQLGQAVDRLSHGIGEQATSTLEARLAALKTSLAASDPMQSVNLAQVASIDPTAAKKEQDEILAELRRRAIANLRTQLSSKPTMAPDLPTLDEVDDRNEATKAAVRQSDAIKQLIADLQFEASLVGKTEVEQRTLTAVRQAGAAATEDQRATITRLVTGIETERRAMAALEEQIGTVKDLAGDFAHSIVSDLRQGVGVVETLSNAFGKLGDRLVDIALDQAIDGLFKTLSGAVSGGFGGGLRIAAGGSLPAGGFIPGLTGPRLFDKGGYTGPGGRQQPAGVVHAGEYVVSAAATRRVGLGTLNAINRGLPTYASGGYVRPNESTMPNLVAANHSASNDNLEGFTFAPSYTIDARGSAMTPEQFRTILEANDRQMRKQLPAMVKEARRRGQL